MFFRRQILLIFFVLILSCGNLFAASETKEQQAYAAAVAAFQDEIWNRAETEFDQFVKKFPNSPDVPQASLLQAQAEFKQGKLDNAIALLKAREPQAGLLADQFNFWIGEAQFAATNFTGAAETFSGLTREFTNSPLQLNAVVNEAAAFTRLGDWSRVENILQDTNGIFSRAAQSDSGNELIARGRLFLVQAKFAQNDFRGASAVLDFLKVNALPPELDWQRDEWIYRLDRSANELDAALADTTGLSQIARLENRADWTAQATAMRAEILEKSNRPLEAAATYAENLTNAPAEQQQQAILKIAEIDLAQNQGTHAEQALENFLAQFTNAPAADVARLTLGELYLKDFVGQPLATNQLLLARTNFDQFINTFTNSPLLGKAFLDRGWANWLAGKKLESLGDFKSATEQLPRSEDLAVAFFKLADAQFAQKDFYRARENYRIVLSNFSDFPAVEKSLGARVLYQIEAVSLKLNDAPAAETAMGQLLQKFSTGEFAEKSLLLAGEGLTDLHSPENARGLFAKFNEQFPHSPLRAEVWLAEARTFEQQQNWDAAITNYTGWLENFPTNTLRPQADYALALANFQAGNESNALAQFTKFIARFPANELAPQAQWWIADYFFRATNFTGNVNFVAAETNYENIFQNTNAAWKNSPLIYPAQLMAGRAAMGRLGFSDAVHYFNGLIADTNCAPGLGTQARFACGAAFMLMPSADTNNLLANFQSATNLFGQIVQLNATNDAGARAWGEIGKCDLQLNDFAGATNAFAQVFNFSDADAAARSQAKIGFGLALEKSAAQFSGTNRTGLLESALQNYLDVLYDDTADSFWRKNAGLQAATLAENLGEWNQAANIFSRLEILLPQLTEVLEKKKTDAQNHLPSKS
jgi:TolA-binding protein